MSHVQAAQVVGGAGIEPLTAHGTAHVSYILEMNDVAESILDKLSQKLGKSKQQVLELAVRLLALAVEVHDLGQEIGIVEPGENPISEFLGLSSKG